MSKNSRQKVNDHQIIKHLPPINRKRYKVKEQFFSSEQQAKEMVPPSHDLKNRQRVHVEGQLPHLINRKRVNVKESLLYHSLCD